MAIRGLPRRAVLAALVVATLLLTILYYSRKVNQLNSLVPVRKPLADNSTSFTRRTEEQPLDVVLKEPQSSSSQECRPVPKRSAADMETVDILPTLNFEVSPSPLSQFDLSLRHLCRRSGSSVESTGMTTCKSVTSAVGETCGPRCHFESLWFLIHTTTQAGSRPSRVTSTRLRERS